MYHYSNQEPYHHNSYTSLDVAKLQNLNTISQEEYHQVLQQKTFQNQYHNTVEDPPPQLEDVSSKFNGTNEFKIRVKKVKSSEKMPKQSTVDTSNFSIEERLVAAVWVHERKHTSHSINEIKHNFRRRFDRDPPSKTTLFAWERKLFSTGNVSDAPRTGRPVRRKQQIPRVAASVREAPALSLRARARALCLPRSTLHHILSRDLSHSSTSKTKNQTDNKRPESRRVRQAADGPARPSPRPPASAPARSSRRPPASAPASAPPPAAAPTPLPDLPVPSNSHMHYVMHTHKHQLRLGYS